MNGLLAELLVELGYPTVKRVPAIMYVGGDIGFRDRPTHVILIVTTKPEGEEWLVDVGDGESAIHPLKHELNAVQQTPEGMISRIVRYVENLEDKKCGDDDGAAASDDDISSTTTNLVLLEWKIKGQWAPRMKWEYYHPGQDMDDFHIGLEFVLRDTSIFAQKLLVCKLSREEKLVLAGTRLKRTRPRFGAESTTIVEELESDDQVRQALEEHFDVPDASTLDLSRSKMAHCEIWSEL